MKTYIRTTDLTLIFCNWNWWPFKTLNLLLKKKKSGLLLYSWENVVMFNRGQYMYVIYLSATADEICYPNLRLSLSYNNIFWSMTANYTSCREFPTGQNNLDESYPNFILFLFRNFLAEVNACKIYYIVHWIPVTEPCHCYQIKHLTLSSFQVIIMTNIIENIWNYGIYQMLFHLFYFPPPCHEWRK